MRRHGGLELIGGTDAAEQLEEERKLRRAWATYLERRAWDHVAHLTAAREANADGMLRAFREGFVRAIASRIGRTVPYFVVVEEHRSGAPHLHTLISGTAALTARELERYWKLGTAKVVPFIPHLGGVSYVVKTIADPRAIYDLSRRRPPLRSSMERVIDPAA